jgi:T5SS/PEP-CTERM-associated repeat protein
MAITPTGNTILPPPDTLVGVDATGTLTINGGSDLETVELKIGVNGGGKGTVTLTGNGSTIDAGDPGQGWISVGQAGTGTLNIQSGADVAVQIGRGTNHSGVGVVAGNAAGSKSRPTA